MLQTWFSSTPKGLLQANHKLDYFEIKERKERQSSFPRLYAHTRLSSKKLSGRILQGEGAKYNQGSIAQ
jgi:hypothetical protein